MEKKRKIEILKDWINAIDKNQKPALFDNISNLENQILFMYTNDPELNNKALVKALLYRMACRDGRYLEKYITLLEKEYNLSGRDLLLYKKFCYAYYILKKEAPDGRIYSEELRKEYIKKFNDIKLEISFLMEFVPEKIAVGPKKIVYNGYENSWKKKAVKNADKADKLERKYEYRKALELHLKNFEKFGYIYSCMKLGKLYDYYKEYDNALKYLKIAIENGRDDAVYTYESIISETAYKKYLDLADKASTTEEEVENMFKAFKYNNDMELALKIARIYLKEGQAYTNIELGKKMLDYYWRFINGNNLEAHFGNFASINFDLYYNGSIYNKNIELACIAYKCLQFMDVEKSKIVSNEMANACNTIHELISNDIIALGGEDIEKQVAKLQVLSKEERIKQYIAAIETDKYDFDYWGRPGESSENLQKRQKYFKEACESKDLEDTIDKLRKSAKLGQAKAMLALYFYYLAKFNYEKAYYWIFEAKYYLKKYKFNEQVFEDMPIDYPMLFKCLDKYQQLPCYFYINDLIDNSDILDDEIIKQLDYYSSKGNNDCKVWLYKYYAEYDLVKAIDLLNDLRAYKEIDYNDLISDYIDVTKIIHKAVIAKLELYASQGNSEFKEILVKYYENHDSDKMLDILYENANSKKPEFIYQIIEANGGLNPIFSERYVEFLLRSNVSSNKYVQYLRALLYSNLELCEKFNLTFSTKEAFHCLYNANSNEDYITKALDVKIKEKLCECYEFGIGTKMDLEAASDLWCRKGGHAVELGHFAKACLPEIYLEANFHQIKEYFLNELKVIEYKNTFDEIKEFIAFDFKIKDLFTSDGKYLGKSMLNQLELRKQERKRLEEERIKREQARLEAIRKEEERVKREQARLEAIRKEEERVKREQARLEAIRKEEERVKKEVTQKAKLQEEKTNAYNKKSSEAINSSINISNNANNSNQAKQSNLKIESPLYCCPIPNDNYYYQSQNPDGGGRIAADEKRAIASLRQTYSYPKDLGEVAQPKNFGFRLIMSKQDKQYIQNRVDNKNKLTEYTRKISELPNPYKTFSINKYRKTVWNLSDNDKIVHGQEFAKILEENFNGKTKMGTIKVKTTNYKYKDRENNISDELYLVERVLTHCPIYAYEITLEIDLKVEYDSSCGDEYFELSNQIEKLYDNRRLSREDTNSLYDNMDEELNEALDRDIKRGEKNKWEAIVRTQKVLDAYVKNMFDKYVVFAGKYINVADKQHYIEGIVHRFKIIYNSH